MFEGSSQRCYRSVRITFNPHYNPLRSMSSTTPDYPDQAFPPAPKARTFAQMVDSLVETQSASTRTIMATLGMTYRAYVRKREFPSELSLEEIQRLATWLGEPLDRIAGELMKHVPNDPDVLGEGIKRHPQGIKRVGIKRSQPPAEESPNPPASA